MKKNEIGFEDVCPECGRPKAFAEYESSSEGESIVDTFRCECGYVFQQTREPWECVVGEYLLLEDSGEFPENRKYPSDADDFGFIE